MISPSPPASGGTPPRSALRHWKLAHVLGPDSVGKASHLEQSLPHFALSTACWPQSLALQISQGESDISLLREHASSLLEDLMEAPSSWFWVRRQSPFPMGRWVSRHDSSLPTSLSNTNPYRCLSNFFKVLEVDRWIA